MAARAPRETRRRGRDRSRSRSRSPASDRRQRRASPPRAPAAAGAPPFPLSGFERFATVAAARREPPCDAETFDFNIFSLHSEGDLEELIALMLEHRGLAQQCGASSHAVRRFAGRVRQCYAANRHNAAAVREQPPYHHFVHALDVTQSAFAMLAQSEARTVLDPLSQLTLLLAALFHDCGHGGRNTPFLVRTHDALVARFGPGSTLEHFHWSLCFDALQAERAAGGLLAELTDEQFVRVCGDARTAILATDIAEHKAAMGSWSAVARCVADGPVAADDPVRVPLIVIMLKSADISNLARPAAQAAAWTELVNEEFFRQGDAEKALGLPVMPGNDRHAAGAGDPPIGFINGVVRPLFQALAQALPGAGYVLEGLEGRFPSG